MEAGVRKNTCYIFGMVLMRDLGWGRRWVGRALILPHGLVRQGDFLGRRRWYLQGIHQAYRHVVGGRGGDPDSPRVALQGKELLRRELRRGRLGQLQLRAHIVRLALGHRQRRRHLARRLRLLMLMLVL